MSISNKELFKYNLVKNCSQCKSICLKSNFHKDKNKKDGLQTYCKQCKKQYYNYDRERAKDSWKRYYEANRQKIIDKRNNYNKK